MTLFFHSSPPGPWPCPPPPRRPRASLPSYSPTTGCSHSSRCPPTSSSSLCDLTLPPCPPLLLFPFLHFIRLAGDRVPGLGGLPGQDSRGLEPPDHTPPSCGGLAQGTSSPPPPPPPPPLPSSSSFHSTSGLYLEGTTFSSCFPPPPPSSRCPSP